MNVQLEIHCANGHGRRRRNMLVVRWCFEVVDGGRSSGNLVEGQAERALMVATSVVVGGNEFVLMG